MEFDDIEFAEITGRNWLSVCLATLYLCILMLKEVRRRIKYQPDGSPYPKGKTPWTTKSLLVNICFRLVEKE